MSIVLAVFLSCWPPPVAGPVVEAFDAPACEFCAGHRGIEIASVGDFRVRAVAAGMVTFAGSVAGVAYVVVRHDSGDLMSTYGQLATVSVHRNDVISAGQVVGIAADRLYFGLRRGDIYVDPAPYLGRLVGRPRLVPPTAEGWRPGPPPVLRCRFESATRHAGGPRAVQRPRTERVPPA